MLPRGGHAADMAKRDLHVPDHSCVLPADPSWIRPVRKVGELIDLLGSAAAVRERDAAHGERLADAEDYILPSITYQAVAELIVDIDDAVLDPDAGEKQVYLVALPDFKVEALWAVLVVLKRARDQDPDAEKIAEMVTDYSEGCFEQAQRDWGFVADLERVLAVLTVETSAVRHVAAVLALDGDRDSGFREAYAQLVSVWQAHGIGS